MLIAFVHPRRHVLRHDLLDRRDGGRAAAHRRRVLLRALGDGSVGDSSPASPRRSSTWPPPASSCTSRRQYADGSRSELLDSTCRDAAGIWWIILYVVFIRSTPRGEHLVQVRDRGGDHLDRDPPRVLGDGARSRGGSRWDSLWTSRPTPARPHSCRTAPCRFCSPCRSRCGSSSASRSCRSPQRNRWTRRETSRRLVSGSRTRTRCRRCKRTKIKSG